MNQIFPQANNLSEVTHPVLEESGLGEGVWSLGLALFILYHEAIMQDWLDWKGGASDLVQSSPGGFHYSFLQSLVYAKSEN